LYYFDAPFACTEDCYIPYLLQRRDEAAAEHLLWSAGGAEGIERITYDQMAVLKLLALAYQRLGRDDQANMLLERCGDLVDRAWESGWATPVLHVRLAEILAAKGRTDEAIDQLSDAVNKGFRDLGWLEYGIFWQDLQDHPGFAGIKLRIIEFIDAERAILERSADAT
jgi:tetratricopeptide (TPR) repeat protein